MSNFDERVEARKKLYAWYAEQDAKKKKIAEHIDGREVKDGRCIHWLSGEMKIGHDPHYCKDRPKHELKPYGWMDHGTFWVGGDGTRYAIGQPYQIDDDDRARLAEYKDMGLSVTINETDDIFGWYGVGTMTVVVSGDPR